jgi:short-subunit dehydrogenase
MARRSIAGSRALVTGASAGIGREIARELAAQGADVLLVARREERLRELAVEFTAQGRRAEFVAGDITDPATRTAAIAAAKERLGGLEILVNNAGVGAMGPFTDADPGRLRRIFEVNFFAPVELIRAALPLLQEGRRPIIVNVASILSHVGLPNISEYSASKFALRGFSEVLRAELHPKGVDVLVISPATVATEMWETMLEVKGDTSWRASQGDTPRHIARKVVKAIRRGRRELLPGAIPKLVHSFHRLCPTVLAWALERKH